MLKKLFDNLYLVFITLIVVKAVAHGLLITDAVLVTGLIALVALREYRLDKKKIDFSADIDARIKSLEVKVSLMGNASQGGGGSRPKNPFMPGMPGT